MYVKNVAILLRPQKFILTICVSIINIRLAHKHWPSFMIRDASNSRIESILFNADTNVTQCFPHDPYATLSLLQLSSFDLLLLLSLLLLLLL